MLGCNRIYSSRVTSPGRQLLPQFERSTKSHPTTPGTCLALASLHIPVFVYPVISFQNLNLTSSTSRLCPDLIYSQVSTSFTTMKRHAYFSGLAALATTLFGLAAADPSVPVAYCASINTGTTDANSSTYQSEGLCYDFCNDDGYALGILQGNDCWCSNYVPDSDDQVSTSKW